MYLYAERYLLVLLAGALVGFSELVARYRDEPIRALKSPPAILYAVLNGACGCLALFLVEIMKLLPMEDAEGAWKSGSSFEGEPYRQLVAAMLISGFGAIAFLRTSVNIRSGSDRIEIGIAAVFERLLLAVDRLADRARADDRERFLSRLEASPFSTGKAALPAYVIRLLQNLTDEEKTRLAEDVLAIEQSGEFDNDLQGKLLAALLLGIGGERLLENAIRGVGEKIGWRIRQDGAPPPIAAPSPSRSSYESPPR